MNWGSTLTPPERSTTVLVNHYVMMCTYCSRSEKYARWRSLSGGNEERAIIHYSRLLKETGSHDMESRKAKLDFLSKQEASIRLLCAFTAVKGAESFEDISVFNLLGYNDFCPSPVYSRVQYTSIANVMHASKC